MCEAMESDLFVTNVACGITYVPWERREEVVDQRSPAPTVHHSHSPLMELTTMTKQVAVMTACQLITMSMLLWATLPEALLTLSAVTVKAGTARVDCCVSEGGGGTVGSFTRRMRSQSSVLIWRCRGRWLGRRSSMARRRVDLCLNDHGHDISDR